MAKYVYSFNEGSKDMRDLLGGKGANLAEMTMIGLPVPFGFTISTDACRKYYEDGNEIDNAIMEEVFQKLSELEDVMGKTLGDSKNPLLVSVRSGSVFSMPGMMDTVLNLGLNDESVVALENLTENKRFALDSYRRFIQMFSDVVMDLDKKKFDEIFDSKKKEKGYDLDIELQPDDLEDIIEKYKDLYRIETQTSFPQDPKKQLVEAIKAVFRSWNNPRAILYRKLHNIDDNLGTAVNIQSMVFGNMGDDSATGVAFTRNPSTGEKDIFGEFLVNAQGEDVVAGIRTPMPISEMADTFPEVYSSLNRVANVLESHYKDMQDMEFTIEKGKLYMLQTRNGKRTAKAAIKIAVDLENEGLIDKKTAIMRLEPNQINQVLHRVFDEEDKKRVEKLGQGLPASPGAAYGRICFHAKDAEIAAENGEKVILVRQETSPEDLAGMVVSEGILTSRGGMTSHAAVVARGMGKCCVSGAADIFIDEDNKVLKAGDKILDETSLISLDGGTGEVFLGDIKIVEPKLEGDFATIMKWADEFRTLKIRSNCDSEKDSLKALEFGAEGIGLCRTEHMFFEEDRIKDMRRMILSSDSEDKTAALRRLLPYQLEDFKDIYRAMEDRPVTIRLLDPPLHEFLPSTKEDISKMAKAMNLSVEEISEKVESLKEFNPMLGHRGCRLAVTYPEIAKMQTEAIIRAAIEISKEKSIDIEPEIMVPLVATEGEMEYLRDIIKTKAEEIMKESDANLDFQIGTMIEIPRAAIVADDIAKHAEFFSFGTNDLTQMTFGFSRDDTGKILKEYLDKGILKNDPFQTIDEEGVGKLVEMAAEKGKLTRANIKLGICGEHGGDPASISFCHNLGLHYVSCSPYRVPVAKIAAAQAAIEQSEIK